jgi:mRNA-degrading endonuclease YafQ of YafQ-DinJ toxin-antitoxin module
MHVAFTARFLRSLEKLSPELQEDAIDAISIYKRSPRNQKLRLHKLSGTLRGYHAISINYRYRIILKVAGKTSYCMDIGTHAVYH